MELKYFCKKCGNNISYATYKNTGICRNCAPYTLGKTCKRCGKPIGNGNITGYCGDCKDFSEDRHCVHCGVLINNKNIHEYCKNCYSKYYAVGENNPFYGKKHSQEVIDKMKEKCRIASQNLWKDEEYRKRNIESTTGLKRGEEFKEKQRKNALIQFKDQRQRDIRSLKMKESWETGKIVQGPHIPYNISKQEQEFFETLSKYINVKQKQVIKYIDKKTKRKRHLFPDIFIEDKKAVIEFNGSFWHADKRLFEDDEIIVHHNIKAGEIRKLNNEKKKLYESLGYNYIEVWSKDYLDNKEQCVKNTIELINKI